MKYKIGDKVKIIGGEDLGMWKDRISECLGEIETITNEPSENGNYHPSNNKWGINFKEEWLEPVEEYKFKKGDKLRVIGELPEGYTAVKVGDIVTFIGNDSEYMSKQTILINDRGTWIYAENVEPVEESSFKIGDRVRIVDTGKNYSTYQEWADAVGAEYYMDHQSFKNGETGEIKAIAPHSAGGTSNDQLLVLVHIDEPHVTKDMIIGIEGIELIADDHEEHLRLYNEAAKFEYPKKEGGEKNMAFIVGDKVKLEFSKGACVTGEFTVETCTDNGHSCGGPVVNFAVVPGQYCHCYGGWTLISSAEKTMAVIYKLTKTQKESWTKDQQALYRVGINDTNGNVTSQSNAIEALVRVNHKALVAQAEADIAEVEAEEAKAKKV